MKILLDECVPKDLCKNLVGYDCHTTQSAGFGGRTNGELLTLAEAAGFDVLLTMDKNIPYQQNLAARSIALIVLKARSNRLRDLLPHVSACLSAITTIKPGRSLVLVSKGGLDRSNLKSRAARRAHTRNRSLCSRFPGRPKKLSASLRHLHSQKN